MPRRPRPRGHRPDGDLESLPAGQRRRISARAASPSDRPRSGRSRNSCFGPGFGRDLEEPPAVHEFLPEVAAEVELGDHGVARRGVIGA